MKYKIIRTHAAIDRAALINGLRFIPGVGPKTATRIADGETVILDIDQAIAQRINAVEGALAAATTDDTTPVTAADPAPVSPAPHININPGPTEDPRWKLLQELLSNGISEARVLELIQQNAGRPATVNLDLRSNGFEIKGEAMMHHKFPLLAAAVAAGVNVMLVGPAGSGKTTAAAKCAEALGLAFYGTGAINSEYKLTGFIDAQGRIVNTAFRTAFEKGGLFLFDEIDASLPSALLAFNAALANDWMDFPDGCVKRHPDFRVVAGANTFGSGADRQYVGRNQLDAASLDRYAFIDWPYDEALEAGLMGAPAPKNAPAPRSIAPLGGDEAQGLAIRFMERVQKVRSAVDTLKVRHVVSPRATLHGAKLLAAGWKWNEVEDAVIWKGIDAETKTKLLARAA